MKRNYVIYFLIFCLWIISGCREKPKQELRFAFIGDLHYMIPDYRTADYLMPSVAKEFNSLKLRPEFIIQTGDFFHGNKGTDTEAEAEFAFKNFGENLSYSFFYCKREPRCKRLL